VWKYRCLQNLRRLVPFFTDAAKNPFYRFFGLLITLLGFLFLAGWLVDLVLVLGFFFGFFLFFCFFFFFNQENADNSRTAPSIEETEL